LTDATSSGQRVPIRTSGLATLVVLRSFVAFGPMPRSTIPLLMKIGSAPFTRKSPAESLNDLSRGARVDRRLDAGGRIPACRFRSSKR
jgi:hypothetical protein